MKNENDVYNEIANIQKITITRQDAMITNLEQKLEKANNQIKLLNRKIAKKNKQIKDQSLEMYHLKKSDETVKLKSQVDSLISIMMDLKVNNISNISNNKISTNNINNLHTQIVNNPQPQPQPQPQSERVNNIKSDKDKANKLLKPINFMDELKLKLTESKYQIDM